MGSKDENHETVAGWFLERDASVEDTHTLGNGAPDMVVGYAGTERWIEVKREAREGGRTGLRSTRCGNCRHQWQKHMGVHPQRCKGGSKKAPCECPGFVPDVGEMKRESGRIQKRQAKWDREWRGHPVEKVETEADVVRVLEDMFAEGFALRMVLEGKELPSEHPKIVGGITGLPAGTEQAVADLLREKGHRVEVSPGTVIQLD